MKNDRCILIVFIGTFYDMTIIGHQGEQLSALVFLCQQLHICVFFRESDHANRLLSFFHLTVDDSDIHVDDTDLLRRGVCVLLRPFPNLNPLDEQPEQFGSQFIDGGEPLCLFDEGIHYP